MPVYEYRCVDCDERFEVEQSMKDPTLKTIQGEDHTHNVKKVFSPVGISFKGSGFYKNDSAGSKKDSPKSSSPDSKSSESGSSSKAESGSGSKPDSPSAPKKNTSEVKAASS
jgi:putative FmdB family regulatory protein